MERRDHVASLTLGDRRGDAVEQVVGIVRGVGHQRDRGHGGGTEGGGAVRFELQDLQGASRADRHVERQRTRSLEDLGIDRPDHRQIALLVDRLDHGRSLRSIVWLFKADVGGMGDHVGRHQQAAALDDGAESLTGEGVFLQPRATDVGMLDRRGDPEDGFSLRRERLFLLLAAAGQRKEQAGQHRRRLAGSGVMESTHRFALQRFRSEVIP